MTISNRGRLLGFMTAGLFTVSMLAIGLVNPATSFAHIAPCTQHYFQRGSTGQCVRDIQFIISNNSEFRLAIDGSFGPATQNAVKVFQSRRGLRADGVVGPQTWGQLCSPVGSAPYSDPAQGAYYYNAGCGPQFAHY